MYTKYKIKSFGKVALMSTERNTKTPPGLNEYLQGLENEEKDPLKALKFLEKFPTEPKVENANVLIAYIYNTCFPGEKIQLPESNKTVIVSISPPTLKRGY